MIITFSLTSGGENFLILRPIQQVRMYSRLLEGKSEFGDTPGRGGVVVEGYGAFVRGRDLLCEDEADATALRLGGVEGHEKIGWIHEAHAVVANLHDGGGGGGAPGDRDLRVSAGRGAESCFDGIAKEVDEELLELVGIGAEVDGRPGTEGDGKAGFKVSDLFEQGSERERLDVGCG